MVGGHTMNRYARHICLPEVGDAGQSAIGNAHILVVGAGGLAAPALQYLVGAGVGRITLIDDDLVALSNLHRQTLFRERDIGKPKAHAAGAALRSLNTDCRVDTHAVALEPVNAGAFVEQSTLVLDCADSFAVSYILSDNCKTIDVPLISASVLGFAGYVGGYCAGAPSLRAVFPDLPDRIATCATAGVMGPIVGMIGAAQAQMALGILIKQSPSPLGQMIHIDMQTFRCGGFRFDNAPEPATDFSFISPTDISTTDYVVELRSVEEVAATISDEAMRLSVAEFKERTLTPRDGQRAVFACKSGLRAWQAAMHLRSYWTGEITLIAAGNSSRNGSKP